MLTGEGISSRIRKAPVYTFQHGMDNTGGCFNQSPAHDDAEEEKQPARRIVRLHHSHPGHRRCQHGFVGVEGHDCIVGHEPGDNHEKTGNDAADNGVPAALLGLDGEEGCRKDHQVIGHVENACPKGSSHSGIGHKGMIAGCHDLGNMGSPMADDQHREGNITDVKKHGANGFKIRNNLFPIVVEHAYNHRNGTDTVPVIEPRHLLHHRAGSRRHDGNDDDHEKQVHQIKDMVQGPD